MRFQVLNLLFPVILAIHNFEEYIGHDRFAQVYHRRLPRGLTVRPVVRNALIALTTAAAALCVVTYLIPSRLLLAASKIAVWALALNGLGHCLMSWRRRTWLPGTVSACALVLPYSAAAVWVMHVGARDSATAIGLYAAMGALAGPAVALAFLGMGHGLARLGSLQ